MELYRLDRPVLPGETEAEDQEDAGELLGEGVASFTLRYVDWEGAEVDSWESEREGEQEAGQAAEPVMPRLIRIDLRLARSSEEGEGVLYRTAVALPCARQVQE